MRIIRFAPATSGGFAGKGRRISIAAPSQIRVRSRPTVGPLRTGRLQGQESPFAPHYPGCDMQTTLSAPLELRVLFGSKVPYLPIPHPTTQRGAVFVFLTRPFLSAQPCPRSDATWGLVFTILFYLACLFPSLPTWRGGGPFGRRRPTVREAPWQAAIPNLNMP